MAMSLPPTKQLLSLFEQNPCWMIQPLSTEMQYAIPSVRRFLAEVGYYSSFSHNGAWYTLRRGDARFRAGVWRAHAVFSHTRF